MINSVKEFTETFGDEYFSRRVHITKKIGEENKRLRKDGICQSDICLAIVYDYHVFLTMYPEKANLVKDHIRKLNNTKINKVLPINSLTASNLDLPKKLNNIPPFGSYVINDIMEDRDYVNRRMFFQHNGDCQYRFKSTIQKQYLTYKSSVLFMKENVDNFPLLTKYAQSHNTNPNTNKTNIWINKFVENLSNMPIMEPKLSNNINDIMTATKIVNLAKQGNELGKVSNFERNVINMAIDEYFSRSSSISKEKVIKIIKAVLE